ncbi:MAG: DNA-deoxyinosine glycosylase [Clostridia bacterium]|nr:DNA-deoxyinosine glycosylase [Clostridia bacterium]
MLSEHIQHPLAPIWTPESRVLILGTMPSPRSRQEQMYYAHPQNRFWPVLAAVYDEPVPHTGEERCGLLCRHRIAVWDVLARCRIEGAADSSIRDPEPNDIAGLLKNAPIQAVFTTGQTAARLYHRLCEPHTGIEAVALPSTSPANARRSLADLIAAYAVLRSYTD